MKKILFLLTLFFGYLEFIAQSFVMSNGGSASTCSGVFTDSGGSGNYAGGSSTITYTICNPTAGQPIYVQFYVFNLWRNACVFGASIDELRVYNGPNAGAPQVAGSPFTDVSQPGAITGTTGCLTFVFQREDLGGLFCASNSGDFGWQATISCEPIPPPTGNACFDANPFCTANTYSFPNLTTGTAPAGPNYGCLGSVPRPVWYYMQVDQAGSFNIALSQINNTGVPTDVDFAMWGPYPSLAAGCANVMSGAAPPIQCSYSVSATEVIGIGLPGGVASGATTPPAANVNDFYIVLLTNFNGSPGIIDFNQTGGSGVADCSIIDVDPDCAMTNFNVLIGTCEAGSVYTLSGDVAYNDPPSSGNLIVQVTSGANTYTQSFPIPLASNTFTNFSISNIPADGLPATVTAFFSADPLCTINIPYTATVGCPCDTEIGTFTTNLTGQTTTDYVLCFGDQLDITPAGGFVAPNQVTTPPAPGDPPLPIYNPHISWLVYTCPPTIGLIPSSLPTQNIPLDPCFIGLIGNGALNELNDQYWLNAYPGQFTNNIVYFVPITMYNDNLYSYVNTTLPCYELGPTYAVQYLPNFTFTQTSNCATGTVTGTFTGGLPAVNASQFTSVAGSLTPVTASFVNTTCNNNGTIQITGLTNGQLYSFQVEDGNGCTVTVSGTFVGSIPATLTYADNEYCISEPDPSPTIVGQQGGSYSSTAGLVLNATTGVVDISASTPGTYTISYNTNINPCPFISTFGLTINGLPTVTASADVSICPNATATLTVAGTAGNTYSWNPGASAGASFLVSPAATTTYTVTGTDSKGCVSSDQVIVTINVAPVVSAGVDQSICLGASVTLAGSVAPVNINVNYTWNNAVVNNTAFIPVVAGSTTYTVTGTNSITTCLATDQVTVVVNALPTVVSNTQPAICIGNAALLTGSTTGVTANPMVYSWNNGITNAVAFTPAFAGIFAYVLTGTDANGCVDTYNTNFQVNALPIVSAGIDQPVCAGFSIPLTATGAATYVWSSGTVNGAQYFPSNSETLTVTGTDINGCVNLDNMNVNVNQNPIPTFTSNINTGCSPLTITFSNFTPNSAISNWTFGDGTTASGNSVTHIFTPVGCYDVTLNVEDDQTCVGESNQLNMICVQPDPIADFVASPAILTQIQSTSTMLNTSTGAVDYIWNFDDLTSSTETSPTHDFPYDNPGNYNVQLIAISSYGCVDTTTRLVIVNEDLIYYIPNTFTPDADNFNEEFKPIFTSGYDPFKYALYIYNRWGELIFESRDTKVGWSGLYNDIPAQDGVYIWKIEFKTKINDARKQLVGHVNLLR